MAAPAFSFSLGDFVAGIQLVRDLVTALNDNAGSKIQFRRLLNELLSLERALTEVRHLKAEGSQASQKIALEQAALQCQHSIEEFLAKNAKFNATLGANTTLSKWNLRANLHKVQWALCRDDAIDQLRAEITGHTLTINTLLATLQLSAAALQSKSTASFISEATQHRAATDETQSLVKQNHNLLTTQADLILTISQTIATTSTHGKTEELQAIMLKVLATNMKIYDMVLEMQKLQVHIPPQVDRQQPVCFEDAHGRTTPIHIEFINSFDAFQAVMEVRFRHVPGLKKVQNKEYSIQESNSKRKLDLAAPWDGIFLPGRKINMSMVFQRPRTSLSSCPGCQTENEIEGTPAFSEVQCSNLGCKIWYQRIIELESEAPKSHVDKRKQEATGSSSRKRPKQLFGAKSSGDEDENEDEINQFRRVHVVHKVIMPRSEPRQSPAIATSVDQLQTPNFYQQPSSFWSPPEEYGFPDMLQHFGTDWVGIAGFMTTKTWVMVKNYYLRHVESGPHPGWELHSHPEWEEIAMNADENRRRGEHTGPPPKLYIIPKVLFTPSSLYKGFAVV